MLPLDSPRWAALSHAYGFATENTSAPTGWSATSGFHGYKGMNSILHCIEQLVANPGRMPNSAWEPWGTLISSLCHQQTIYPASFAVVPHIIDIGIRAAAECEIDVRFFLLPTIIEQSRLDGQKPETEPDILAFHMAAVSRLHEMANAVQHHSWPLEYAATVSAALAVSKGHLQLSKCFLECSTEDTLNGFLKRMHGD